MDLVYPKHKHPHGIQSAPSNECRIWVCDECGHIFTDAEIKKDAENNKDIWGHICKTHQLRKGQRCESHLEPYIPDEKILQMKG